MKLQIWAMISNLGLQNCRKPVCCPNPVETNFGYQEHASMNPYEFELIHEFMKYLLEIFNMPKTTPENKETIRGVRVQCNPFR